jgi:multicomponent Na+:H+ antiporter subunit D
MIRGWGRTTVAATRYMIFSLMGSAFFLIGVILLYDVTGHLLIPNVSDAVAKLWLEGTYRLPLLITIGLIVTGLGIKSGMFPLHLLDAGHLRLTPPRTRRRSCRAWCQRCTSCSL